MTGNHHKMLSIFIGQADLWHETKLSDALVLALERQGIAGVTVIEGTVGFGVHRRVHRKGLFGVSDEKPTVILAVDEEELLRAALPKIKEMVWRASSSCTIPRLSFSRKRNIQTIGRFTRASSDQKLKTGPLHEQSLLARGSGTTRTSVQARCEKSVRLDVTRRMTVYWRAKFDGPGSQVDSGRNKVSIPLELLGIGKQLQ